MIKKFIKCDVTCSLPPPLPLSQTVTPSRTPHPLERDVLYGRPLGALHTERFTLQKALCYCNTIQQYNKNVCIYVHICMLQSIEIKFVKCMSVSKHFCIMHGMTYHQNSAPFLLPPSSLSITNYHLHPASLSITPASPLKTKTSSLQKLVP